MKKALISFVWSVIILSAVLTPVALYLSFTIASYDEARAAMENFVDKYAPLLFAVSALVAIVGTVKKWLPFTKE